MIVTFLHNDAEKITFLQSSSKVSIIGPSEDEILTLPPIMKGDKGEPGTSVLEISSHEDNQIQLKEDGLYAGSILKSTQW